jgi:hypothetical protein
VQDAHLEHHAVKGTTQLLGALATAIIAFVQLLAALATAIVAVVQQR